MWLCWVGFALGFTAFVVMTYQQLRLWRLRRHFDPVTHVIRNETDTGGVIVEDSILVLGCGRCGANPRIGEADATP